MARRPSRYLKMFSIYREIIPPVVAAVQASAGATSEKSA